MVDGLVGVRVSCTRGWWAVWWVLMGPWISWVPKVGMFLKMGWATWVVLTMGAGWWVAMGAGMWVWMVSATGWVRVEIWGRWDVVEEGQYGALGKGEGVFLVLHVHEELADQFHVVDQVFQIDVRGDRREVSQGSVSEGGRHREGGLDLILVPGAGDLAHSDVVGALLGSLPLRSQLQLSGPGRSEPV